MDGRGCMENLSRNGAVSRRSGPQSYNCKEMNVANNQSELGNRLIPGASRKECNLADTVMAAWGD